MPKLYGGTWSRAAIVQWYLVELGLDYEFVLVDLATGEQRQDPYTAINPFGKVPAWQDDTVTMWESGAILLYLAERYGGLTDLAQRAIASQWIFFANATLTDLFHEQTREAATPRLLGTLDRLLSQSDLIMGDAFSVADVAIASMLGYAVMMLKLDYSPYPAVQAYLGRTNQREAFQKTIGASRP